MGWQAAPSPWHLGNKGNCSENIIIQWRPKEGSLSNDSVKCWEPSGYERLCQVSSWKQKSFPGPLDAKARKQGRGSQEHGTATWKRAWPPGRLLPYGHVVWGRAMVGPATRKGSGAAYFKNKAYAVYLQIKVGS